MKQLAHLLAALVFLALAGIAEPSWAAVSIAISDGNGTVLTCGDGAACDNASAAGVVSFNATLKGHAVVLGVGVSPFSLGSANNGEIHLSVVDVSNSPSGLPPASYVMISDNNLPAPVVATAFRLSTGATTGAPNDVISLAAFVDGSNRLFATSASLFGIATEKMGGLASSAALEVGQQGTFLNSGQVAGAFSQTDLSSATALANPYSMTLVARIAHQAGIGLTTAIDSELAAAPVPLPAGIWLLGTSLLLLFSWMSRLQTRGRNDQEISWRRSRPFLFKPFRTDWASGHEFGPEIHASRKISIVSINYSPELTGIAVYSTGMAEYLAAQGHEVDVFCGFPYYPQWKKMDADKGVLVRQEYRNGVRLRRHWLYVPAVPSAMKRILHELSFVCSVTFGYLMAPRSACTIIVSPPLLIGIPIAILAWFKGSRTVFHVQDLQPDAAVELGMLPPGPITRILYALERITYYFCDRVGTVSEAMRRRIEAKGVATRKLFLFRNWANQEVRSQSAETSFRKDWKLDGKFVVLYAGNMGVKQGLAVLLECAQRTAAEEDILYVIVGDGGEKEKLVARAESMGLGNVIFRPLQPLERLGELLATADVSVIPQKSGVRDIAMPSKLGNILGSARPVIVAADADSELANVIKEAGCGRIVAQGDAPAMVSAIRELARDRALCKVFGDNGQHYCATRLERGAILKGLVTQLDSLFPAGAVSSLDQAA